MSNVQSSRGGGGGQKASFFQHHKGERDDGDVGNRNLPQCCTALDVGELGPEILEGFVKVPRLRPERGAIALQFFGSHADPMLSAEMHKHGMRCIITKKRNQYLVRR